MNSYYFSSPTKVYFGNDVVKEALIREKNIIGKKTLIVSSGNSLNELGYLQNLKGYIDAKVFVYDEIRPDPDVSLIRKAIEIGKKNKVESVIGFGGGSAIDAAKATAVGVASNVDIEEYLLTGRGIPEDTLPIIAIPTTAGTGAELTKGAIISSRAKGIKTGIRGDKVTPKLAIINPSYTYSIPLNTTMETGFDVFAHAAESYCSKKANAYSEMISERAIRIVGKALPRLNNNLEDKEARDMMCYASHIVGYNVRNVGNCLPHRLQYPIGVSTNTSHGAGLIALYPSWIKHEHSVNNSRVDRVLEWLGVSEGKDAYDRIRGWLSDLDIYRTISDLKKGVDIEDLVRNVKGDLTNDMLSKQKDIVKTIYHESL